MKPIISLLMLLSMLTFTTSCSDNVGNISNNIKSKENSNAVNMKQIKEKITATENKINEAKYKIASYKTSVHFILNNFFIFSTNRSSLPTIIENQ